MKTQAHLQSIQRYLSKWKLQTNSEKTQFIIMDKKLKNNDLTLFLNNTRIQQSDHVKYLGVTLDKGLTFKRHIQLIKGKLCATSQFLYPFICKSSKLTSEMKIRLFKAYFEPVLSYAAPIWSSASKTEKMTIFRKHSKILRLIAGVSWRDRITNEEIHRTLSMERIEEKLRARTRKFFTQKVRTLPITDHIGRLNSVNIPFRKKHKLIHDLIYE